MWVFDGEEWTQEGGGSSAWNPKQHEMEQRPQWADEFVPELQVIEIVQIPSPATNHVPPFPLP